ncbi:MAG: nucleotide exchange factor GrpE [Kiloniellales bacterium]
MSNPSKTSKEQAQEEAASKANGQAAEEETVVPEGVEPNPLVEGEIPEVHDESPVERLEAEVASLKDQLLRALAETENVRRRAQREREDTARFAAAPVIKDLLGVADNLGRALGAVSDELAADERVQPLIDGIKLTEKELLAAFERHNIKKIEPLGERLDPHLHEAMFEIEDASKPAGTVVQVLQPGYRLHDRLLRPARVGVAKGGGAKGVNDNDSKPGSHVDTTA